jgi:hypothetical protein
MSQTATQPPSPSSIEAGIVYLVYTGEAPVFHQSLSAADRMAMAGQREKKVVTIRNGRLEKRPFSLDVEGFVLGQHNTKVTDFFDDTQIASIYTPEVEQLVAKHTGASKVVVFDHTRRSSAAATREKHSARDPVAAAHVDYNESSARQRLRDVLGDEADTYRGKRFSIINVWRSMSNVIQEWPLAVCDARTIDDALLHSTVRHAPVRAEPSFEYSRSSETRHAAFDANHKWFYFPNMTRNEALLFKNYDTQSEGTARHSMHTAFEDPNTPANPAPRESIESRVFAFYD